MTESASSVANPRPVVIAADDAGGSGSVSSVVRNHARELARYRPVILVSTSLPSPPLPGVRGIAVTAPSLRGLRRFAHVPRLILQALAIRRAIRRLCQEGTPAALIVHSHALAVFAAQPLRKAFGLRSILVVHADIFDRPAGSYDPRLTAFYRWVAPIAYRGADRIVAISGAIAQGAVRHGGSAERVVVIPNGIDEREIGLDRAGPAADPNDPVLRLLYVGRLGVEKGVSDLLVACGILREKGVRFRLTIAGDGPLRAELEAQAQSSALKDHVHWIGAQPRESLGALYRGAHITCVPSLSEPQGIVVLESLIAGTPVVASDAGGIPDMVREGINGRLTPPGQPESLAEIIGGLAMDDRELARLAANAPSSVVEEYSWPAIGRRLGRVADEMIFF